MASAFEKADELAIDLVVYLENAELGIALSTDCLRQIRDSHRKAWDAALEEVVKLADKYGDPFDLVKQIRELKEQK